MNQLVEDRRWWQSFWARAVLILGVWTVIGLVFSAQWYFAAFRSEDPVPWSRALYVQMSWGYLWGLATPLILWLVRRFPIDKQKRAGNVPLHLLTSTLLVFIVGIIGHIIIYLNYGRALGRPYLFQNSLRFAVNNFTEGIGVYLLVAFLTYAYN